MKDNFAVEQFEQTLTSSYLTSLQTEPEERYSHACLKVQNPSTNLERPFNEFM